MKFMLDTDICIYIIKRKPEKVLRHFEKYKVGEIGISSITLAELQYGVEKSQHSNKNSEALSKFALPLEIASFDEKAAQIYGIVRAELERAGNPIGSMDTLIGAHALCLGITLVTNNTKEFGNIKGLRLANWTF